MKNIYLPLMLLLVISSCSRNDERLSNASPSTFNKILLRTDLTALSVAELTSLMQKDPEVLLLRNKVVRNTEMLANNDFAIFDFNTSTPLKQNGLAGKPAQIKDRKGRSLEDYNQDLFKNYMMVYTKYVLYKKVPKDVFKAALTGTRPTKKMDLLEMKKKHSIMVENKVK